MSFAKRVVLIAAALILIIFLSTSCSDNKEGGHGQVKYDYPDVEQLDINKTSDSSAEDAKDAEGAEDAEDVESVEETQEKDTYEQDCIKCEYYFCPPLDEIWQKEICIDSCTDPPTVVLESA